MHRQHINLTRLVAAGLAAAAIAPAAAVAAPAQDLRAPDRVDGGIAVVKQDLRAPDRVDGGIAVVKQDLRAPDQADGTVRLGVPGPPQWPVNPQPIVPAQPVSASQPSSDDGGLDTGVWIALAGSALLAVGGIGLLSLTRLRAAHQHRVA